MTFYEKLNTLPTIDDMKYLIGSYLEPYNDYIYDKNLNGEEIGFILQKLAYILKKQEEKEDETECHLTSEQMDEMDEVMKDLSLSDDEDIY